MVSYVFQWAKSILIIYFDAQIVPDLLFLTTSVSFLLASSFFSGKKDIPGSPCSFSAQAWNESFT